MRFTRRQLLGAPIGLATAWALPRLGIAGPLWPGARFTREERDRAVRRGMQAIYRMATTRTTFAAHGEDLLWCFYSISATAADPELKQMAWRMGRERARQWRKANWRVPPRADADEVSNLIYGSHACDCLGLRNERMKRALARAAARFSATQFLRFDPAREPVPADIPDTCPRCQTDNLRGVRHCRRCKTELAMLDPYEVLCDTLVTAYSGDRYGVRLGASLADVMALVPRMRPYRDAGGGTQADFIAIAYAITHVIYTLNDYGVYRLRPEWLPDEFAFLKANLGHNIKADDAETMGEFLDTLKAFGLTEQDPLIQAGTEFVMAKQNRDGSWGAPDDDVYTRYHATWTAVGGLMDYAFAGEGVSFPDALKKVRGDAQS